MASTLAVQSPADVLNVALARMGSKLRVGSLLEGSLPAKKALDLYAQTRDQLLRGGDWPFAQRAVAGTLLKSAPITASGAGYFPPATWNPATNPPLPWLYSYAYPGDCLEVRIVKPVPLFMPDYAPKPYLFDVVNDSGSVPAVRVIVSNVSSPVIVYTGQITDPTQMPPDFVSDLADSLGEGLSALLANPEMLKMLAAQQQGDEARASERQG